MNINESDLQSKGFVRGPDGEWHKAKSNKVGAEGLPASQPESVKRLALVRRVPREEKSGPCFMVRFIAYAVRPCDWDGYHIKPIQDLLCHAGLLPGDAWHQLEGSVSSRKVHSPEEERLEILITPL